MAFDGLFTTAMVAELQILQEGRISKIHQPNAQELIFLVRSKGQNHKLLLSIHPSFSRIQLTAESLTNPPEPPLFCMVLRKHLEGGFITSIEQMEADRIIIMSIRAKNEIGDDIERQLHIEVMGRHSNIILVDPERNMIIESFKHLPPSVNSYRTVLPGQPFISAPSQDKINPFTMTDEQFSTLWNTVDNERDFVKNLSGFSPVNATELFSRLQKTDNPTETFKTFLRSFNGERPQPVSAIHNKKMIYSATELTSADQILHSTDTLSALLDKVYFERAERERVRSQAADLERWLDNEINKLKAKAKKLEREQQAASKLDLFQLYGELITANNYQMVKGDKEVTLENYYEQGTTVTIPLDSRKSPIENAQHYFKRYAKAKNALIMIAQQLEKTADDIHYFEMVKQQVMQASPIDIAEIREELAELGFMRARRGKKKMKLKRPKPETYRSTSGIDISVGKNNKQNDYLTFKMANRHDVWLHTKDIPGSHVVIHHDNPDEQTILEAAALSAYFSKARDSSSVPVDYTEVRHVKKPSGAKPGFVIYFEQKTVFVTPEEDLVRKLRR